LGVGWGEKASEGVVVNFDGTGKGPLPQGGDSRSS